jgi:hypothetical protein
MLPPPFTASRAWLTALLLLGCVTPVATVQAQAQTEIQAQPLPEQQQPEAGQETAPGNQKIEHIRIEDSGNTIDELRVGGRTQNITVQPKSNAPAYQVEPNGDRSRGQGKTESNAGDSGGSRVWWNVLKF